MKKEYFRILYKMLYRCRQLIDMEHFWIFHIALNKYQGSDEFWILVTDYERLKKVFLGNYIEVQNERIAEGDALLQQLKLSGHV